MRKAGEYLGILLAILLMTAALLTYIGPHLGWRVDVLCSGSMEPQLKVGDLVVTRPVEPEAIVMGDIITFYPTDIHENLLTHRVIDIEKNSPLSFKTKGDASDIADPFTVPARNLVGRICFRTPYLGYVARFLKTPTGFTFGLVLPGLAIVVMCIVNIQRTLASYKVRTG